MSLQETHFIPWDAPAIGRRRRAYCGALVADTLSSTWPTCPECRKVLEEHDRLLRLEAEPE